MLACAIAARSREKFPGAVKRRGIQNRRHIVNTIVNSAIETIAGPWDRFPNLPRPPGPLKSPSRRDLGTPDSVLWYSGLLHSPTPSLVPLSGDTRGASPAAKHTTAVIANSELRTPP